MTTLDESKNSPKKRTTNEKPVSIHGVPFDDYGRAILHVKPLKEKRPQDKPTSARKSGEV